MALESALETARIVFSTEAVEARVGMSRQTVENSTKTFLPEKYYTVPRTTTASTESSLATDPSLIEEGSPSEEEEDDRFNSLQVEPSPMDTVFIVPKEPNFPDTNRAAAIDPCMLGSPADPRVKAMLQATSPKPYQAAGQEEPDWDDVVQYCRGLGGTTLRMIGMPQGGVRSLGLM